MFDPNGTLAKAFIPRRSVLDEKIDALTNDGYKLYKPFIPIRNRMPNTPSPLHMKRVPKRISPPTDTAEAAATVAETIAAPLREPTVKKARRVEAVEPSPPNAKPAKPHKPKLVRDSFTIPKDEYHVLDALKRRALGLEHHVRKSELLRAGIQALAAMNDRAFLKAISAVPTLKTGRPRAD